MKYFQRSIRKAVQAPNSLTKLAEKEVTAASEIDTGNFEIRSFLQLEIYVQCANNAIPQLTFNNDATTYSFVTQTDGGAQASQVSQGEIDLTGAATTSKCYSDLRVVLNKAAVTKRVVGCTVVGGGPAAAPSLTILAGVFAETTNAIKSVQVKASDAGNVTGKAVVWGAN